MRGLIASLLGERRIAVVSGGFDPLHSGHVRMFEEAQRFGAVIAIVNSDEWLARKKGRPFMNLYERTAVISALRAVAQVQTGVDWDDTVKANLSLIRVTYPQHIITFCNGGDRTEGNTPEEEFCRSVGIELAYGVGGGKTQSSSLLIAGLAQPDN